jgi:hypothetical protein
MRNQGGKRPGAGRPKGTRNKGPTKANLAAQVAKEAAAEGETPLTYMLRVMRDAQSDPKRRDEMARAAAPYMHSRLESVAHEHTGADKGPILMLSTTDLKNLRG